MAVLDTGRAREPGAENSEDLAPAGRTVLKDRLASFCHESFCWRSLFTMNLLHPSQRTSRISSSQAPNSERRGQLSLLVAAVGLLSACKGAPEATSEKQVQEQNPAPSAVVSPPQESTKRAKRLGAFSLKASVVGVRAPDVLNVRKEPNAKAPIVVGIPANGEGVLSSGPHRMVGNSTWIRVSYEGQVGWANQRFLEFEDRGLGIQERLECLGTEPFWALQIDPSGLGTFESMDKQGIPFLVEAKENAQGRTDLWHLSFAASTSGKLMTAFLSASGNCSDDMSDHRYKYEVFLSKSPLGVLKGCCNRIEQGGKKRL